jgi:hypothetical protein
MENKHLLAILNLEQALETESVKKHMHATQTFSTGHVAQKSLPIETKIDICKQLSVQSIVYVPENLAFPMVCNSAPIRN